MGQVLDLKRKGLFPSPLPPSPYTHHRSEHAQNVTPYFEFSTPVLDILAKSRTFAPVPYTLYRSHHAFSFQTSLASRREEEAAALAEKASKTDADAPGASAAAGAQASKQAKAAKAAKADTPDLLPRE
eukprot:1909180-Pleurochrysis_carterae.AAC.1